MLIAEGFRCAERDLTVIMRLAYTTNPTNSFKIARKFIVPKFFRIDLEVTVEVFFLDLWCVIKFMKYHLFENLIIHHKSQKNFGSDF